MTKPQQSLERQHERLEQETREGLSDNGMASRLSGDIGHVALTATVAAREE